MRSKRSIHHRSNTIHVKNVKKKQTPAFLILLSLLLALFGITMIFNVSSISAISDFNDQYYYVKEQGRWFLLAIGSMVFFSLYDYKRLYALALPLLAGSVLLLLAVFIRGIGIHVLGASRWLDLGFITLQPSELVKLTLIIYLAAWFSHRQTNLLKSFLILILITVGPIILQPDLGSAVVILSICFTMYFLSGAPLWQFLLLIPMIFSGIAFLAISASYRLERVKTFLNPDLDPQGTSYHLRQILIAVGTGGWFGLGLGKSRQKYAYIPEVTTDSIFAVIAEEIGFIGSTVIFILFLFLLFEGIKIAKNAKDDFGRLLAIGFTCALGYQIIINLGAMVSLLPLTGIPLPFLSYGGSSLIISFTMVGILVNISRNSKA